MWKRTREDVAQQYGPPPIGFDPGTADLPQRHRDLTVEGLEAAARIVAAIALQATPEDVARGDFETEVRDLWMDRLQRDEAMAHVDLLVAALAPLGAAA
ncbi:hypothetical protein [Baekduia alba]|uniref:hypothetical protein n=1 Tax=Baekduia alba TaxID=2997333 RepID=UPI0023405FAB|nr:hypothetical protein [Baekduia alba]